MRRDLRLLKSYILWMVFEIYNCIYSSRAPRGAGGETAVAERRRRKELGVRGGFPCCPPRRPTSFLYYCLNNQECVRSRYGTAEPVVGQITEHCVEPLMAHELIERRRLQLEHVGARLERMLVLPVRNKVVLVALVPGSVPPRRTRRCGTRRMTTACKRRGPRR